MAMKINLPTDPKQRQQIFALAGIGVIALIVVFFMFVITPQRKKKQEKVDKIALLEKEIEQSNKDTQNLASDRQTDYETLHKIMEDVVTPHFIHDELGNFNLPADRILKSLISETGIPRSDIAIQELGLNDFMVTPGVQNDKTHICRSYTVQVTLKCGFSKLTEVLAHIQESNPYIAINSLTIVDIGTEIRRHQVAFQVQWPAWRTPEQKTKIETDFKAAEASAIKPITSDPAANESPASQDPSVAPSMSESNSSDAVVATTSSEATNSISTAETDSLSSTSTAQTETNATSAPETLPEVSQPSETSGQPSP